MIVDDTEAIAIAQQLAAEFVKGDSERDRQGKIPLDEVNKYSQSGLWGITVPKEYGGAFVSNITLAEVTKIISEADSSLGQIPQNHLYIVESIRLDGTEEQKRFFFNLVLQGKRFGNAFSEIGTKSVTDVQTRLEKSGDGYVLNGRKFYSSGALVADWIPVIARNDDDKTVIALVERGTPGLNVIDDWSSFGQRTTASGTTIIENVQVSAEHVIPHFLAFERPTTQGPIAQIIQAAVDVGIAKAALRDTIHYVHNYARPWIDVELEHGYEDPLTIYNVGSIVIQVHAAEALLRRSGEYIDQAIADPTDISVAEASILKSNGYETALVGKWHCGYPPNYGPLKSGFDEYLGNLSGGIDYFTHKDGGGVVDFYEGEAIADRAGYATDLYTERAVEFIQRDRSKPFYLSLHYNAPHWPWEGPENEELSRTFYNSNGYTAGGSTEIYAAMVQRLDEGVGKVLEALDQSGQADNTLVIFASDNGGERYSYFGPFQGRKGSLYEGGIRVPTLIRYPGVIRANQVSKQVIITHDLTATILAATRTSFDPDYPLDGVDLIPLLRDKRKVLPRTLFWRYGGAEPRTQKAVRKGDWKYLNLAGEEYLFDLSTDLGETVDLKDSHPKVFTHLRNQFEDWNSQVLPYES